MPTPKNGFQILNLHLKKHIFKEKNTLFYVLMPKYYQKSEKAAKSEKNRKNLIFFLTENGLKCIIGTPRNTFKSPKSVKTTIKSAKSDFSDLT